MTVTPSLAAYIFLAAKAESLQSAESLASRVVGGSSKDRVAAIKAESSEGRPKRANKPKRHCSPNTAVPLVSSGVFVVSGLKVGQ